jgi:hypothetical protein
LGTEGFSKISTYSAGEISSLMANLSKTLFLQGKTPSANANLTIEEKFVSLLEFAIK